MSHEILRLYFCASSRSSASRSSRRELIAAAAASPVRKIAGEPIFVSDGQTIRSDPLYTLSLRKSGRKESLSLIQVETVQDMLLKFIKTVERRLEETHDHRPSSE
jgi:hypothetical protein